MHVINWNHKLDIPIISDSKGEEYIETPVTDLGIIEIQPRILLNILPMLLVSKVAMTFTKDITISLTDTL